MIGRVRKFKTMPVMGIPFELTWDTASMPADSKSDYGETVVGDRLVHINVPRHRSVPSAESTVLHEFIHAVLGVSGQDEHIGDKEEGVVKALESGLYPIIVELVELGYFRKPKESE